MGKVLTVIVRRAERESRLERTQGGGVNQIRRGCSYLRNKMLINKAINHGKEVGEGLW